MQDPKQFKTQNGLIIVPSLKFHQHSQITDELLQEAIMGESELIERAFMKKGSISFTHTFPHPIGVTHCIPCPPHSPGVYFKQREDRPYLSRMVKGKPIPTSQLTFVLYTQGDMMVLITAWVGGPSLPEIGNISKFERDENPIESIMKSAEFWMNHALVEEDVE